VKTIPPPFFCDHLMFSSLKSLIADCIFLALISTSSVNAAPQGFVEGHLKIISGRPVELADENADTATAENYGDYPLIVLSQSDRKQMARIPADLDGKYRTALPPGDYVLDVEGRVAKRLRVSARPFTVVANETVRVDLTIVTGLADESSTQQE